MRTFSRVLPAVLVCALTATTIPAAATQPLTEIGYQVFSRTHGIVVAQKRETTPFRSASIVKLLIALDYLWDRGPSYDIPAADQPILRAMLRESDDRAASELWVRGGWERIVLRMTARLGLQQTRPPAKVGMWGYTAISAADTVRIYRYILHEAPTRVRDLMMDNLRAITRCAGDKWDQYFGIPTVFPRDRAAKQGWSGFGDPRPDQRCLRPRAKDSSGYIPGPLAFLAGPGDIDLTHPAMHTTGTVGADNETIVAVFTLHRKGTSWETATASVNDSVRRLEPIVTAVTPPGPYPLWSISSLSPTA